MPRKRPETADVRDPFPQIREMLDLVLLGTGQSVSALARATQVDRHKLSKILEKQNVALSLLELRQLDQYLSTLGVDLISKKDLPQLLAEAQPVSFLVPVANTPLVGRSGSRTTTSLWDVRAMNQIRELLGPRHEPREALSVSQPRQAGFLIQPVPSNQPLSAPGVIENVQRLIEGGHSSDGTSQAAPRPKAVISFGSPRASVASEYMLRQMFSLAPEEARTAREFFFLWGQPTPLDRDSRFAEAPEGFNAALLTRDDESRLWSIRPAPECDWLAFRPNREPWQVRPSLRPPSDGSPHDWQSFGIVATQRRNGQLWVVIAGLTGPDTLAATDLLESFAPVLVRTAPRADEPPVSCTVWWVVQTTLHQPGEPLETDLRTIRSVMRISGPNVSGVRG